MKNKILLLMITMLATSFMFSQDDEEGKKVDRLDFSARIKSNHLWRGLIITDKPMIEGTVTYAFNKAKTFKFGLWGASAFSDDSDDTHYKEINYFLKYSNDRFSIGVWDLFNTRGVDDPDIWDYSQHSTTHFIDLRTNYLVSENFPLTLEADMILYGRGDTELDGDDLKQRYSTYLQVSYPVIMEAESRVDAFLGAGLALNGDTHMYGNGENKFDVVNVGFTISRKLHITDSFSLPVTATALWNPSKEYARIQLAISF